jgi:hypothetical protein
MISDKQLQANRNNAQKSTGPRTKEGRNRSRLNALRHGLTGQVTTMTDEDRAAHDQFCQALIHSLAPEGAMETQLAQSIATVSWRLNRASAMEDNLFALDLHESSGELFPDDHQVDAALATARVLIQRPQELHLLALYHQRLNRVIQQNLAMLQSLQAARLARRETEMKEAALLLQVSEVKGLEYEPAKDGFVFSPAEIRSRLDRQQRLQRASTTDFTKLVPRSLEPQAA